MGHSSLIQSDRYRADGGPKTNDEPWPVRTVQVRVGWAQTQVFVPRPSSSVSFVV